MNLKVWFYCKGIVLALMTYPVFAAYGLCHQDPDRILDPRPSQRPAGQNAQGEIPDPGDDV